jgi:hypothetical protein
VRDVGEFGATERHDFIDAFMRDANLAMSAALRQSLSEDSESLLPMAAQLINFAHTFVESAGMHRVKVGTVKWDPVGCLFHNLSSVCPLLLLPLVPCRHPSGMWSGVPICSTSSSPSQTGMPEFGLCYSAMWTSMPCAQAVLVDCTPTLLFIAQRLLHRCR